jgi:hypothetical protein
MKLDFNSYLRDKLIVSLFMFTFLIIPNGVAGNEYVFEDDFSSGTGDWEFFSVDWSNFSTAGATVIDSTMAISNERLVCYNYENAHAGGIWDHAYQPTNITDGIWEFKAQYSGLKDRPDLWWGFDLILEDRTSEIWELGGTIPSDYRVSGVFVTFKLDTITVDEETPETSASLDYSWDDNFNEFGVDYTYTFAKNGPQLTVFINEIQVLEYKLSLTQSTKYNHFGIGTARPMIFDDFKVSKIGDTKIIENPSDMLSDTGDAEITENPSDISTDNKNEDSEDSFLTFNRIVIILSVSSAVLAYKFVFSKKNLKI